MPCASGSRRRTWSVSCLWTGVQAYGLFHEIIAWKLRMFVPTDGRGIEVLAKVLERYPLQRIVEREGA